MHEMTTKQFNDIMKAFNKLAVEPKKDKDGKIIIEINEPIIKAEAV